MSVNTLPSIVPAILALLCCAGIVVLLFSLLREKLVPTTTVATAPSGEPDTPKEQEASGVEITEDSLPFLLDEIALAIKNEHYSRAEDLCNQVMGVFPEHLGVMALQAKTLAHSGNPGKEAGVLRNIIKHQEQDYYAKKRAAQRPPARGKKKKSLNPLAEINSMRAAPMITQEIPGTQQTLPPLAEQYVRLGTLLEQVGKVMRTDLTNDGDGNDLDCAQDAYQRCIDLFPNHAPAYQGLATILEKQEAADPAVYLPYYEQAFRYDGDLLDVGILLANSYFMLEDYTKAALYFNKVLLKNEQHAEATKGLALVYMKQRQLLKAHSTMEHAIALGAADVTAYSALGSISFQLEKFPEALAAYEQAIAQEPSAVRYYNLALSHKALQNKDETLSALEQAVDLAPEKLSYLELYAELLIEADQEEKAKTYWEKIAALDPENKKAKLALARLA